VLVGVIEGRNDVGGGRGIHDKITSKNNPGGKAFTTYEKLRSSSFFYNSILDSCLLCLIGGLG
jgi:hypothetical protein